MKKMKKFTTRTITIIAFSVALNYIGGAIALFLRLPIYLDSIGTIFSATLLGPGFGALTGTISALLSGITADLFSLYYAPVQIITGLCAGFLLNGKIQKSRLPLQALLISFPGTVAASLITVFLFGGITSSGSSILVQVLSGLGLDQTASIILIQAGTDYLDRLLAVVLVAAVVLSLGERRVFQQNKS
ncbi:hypothetical protein D920_02765 [Enterococcus faecalis 13-SD-W-01]|jgi:energy-coupling factor transport system substrate-specific component|nr:hypothetical protein D920_02765 [Enterococcus faecalis 13-SD-W-01]